MNIQRIVHTHGDPLGTVRSFLRAVWDQGRLDGMLVAAGYTQPAASQAGLVEQARLIEQAGLIDEVNPFSPLMTENLARELPRLIGEQSGKRLGVLLRPCELRALVEVAKHTPVNLENLLTVCVDCLGTLPGEDFKWRAERAESTDELSNEVLQFARQGGILDYRHRMACQMCAMPGAQLADLNINLLGLPVRQHILVQARDAGTADRLHLDQITDGEAGSELADQHEHALAQLAERRQRTLERVVKNLAEDQPHDLETLIAQLEQCGECQDCMAACPICTADFPERGEDGHFTRKGMVRWLVSCAGCGMCEQACSSQLPLATIFSLIREQLDEELRYSPGTDWDTPLPV
jgi:formate dehydrogenase (coenzyme F420) beta subunit